MTTEWLDKAKCRNMNPRQFDLVDRRIYEPASAAEAQRLCSGCEVVQACAAEAVSDTGYRLQTTTRAGVWVPDTAHKSYREAMEKLVSISKGVIPC